MLRRRLPEGSRENSLWDGWLESLVDSNNVAGSSHNPLQSFAVASGAVSKPGGDAAGQDALHSAGVEWSEDAGVHSKLPQPSQEKSVDVSSSALHLCEWTCEILGDVNTEELKAVYSLHRCLVDGDGCVFSALSPEIHHQLLGLVDVEWEVSLNIDKMLSGMDSMLG